MILEPHLTFVVGIAPFDAIPESGPVGQHFNTKLTPALVQLARLLGRQAAREYATASLSAHHGMGH